MATFSELYTRDKRNLARAVRLYYKFLLALAVPVALAGAVLAPVAVPIVFGSPMRPAAPFASLFFVLFSLSFLGTPLSMALYVLERTQLVLAIYTVQAIINVGLDLVLIPRWGLAGAVVPVGLVVALSPVVYWICVTRLWERPALPWTFLLRSLAANAGWLILLPLSPWITNVPRLAAAILLGLTATVVGVRLTRLLGEEESRLLTHARFPARRLVCAVLGVGARSGAENG
jgi:O-antigen/teichoic acid export membrane protein